MPDNKGNLYVYEGIELRNEYDRHVKLLETVLRRDEAKLDRWLHRSDDEKEYASDFDPELFAENLGKLQAKRVKLNQAIQIANFETTVMFRGETISIAEALELRKNLLQDLEASKQRALNSAFRRVIHKEERDIVQEPKHSFGNTYDEFQTNLKNVRELINLIHVANHGNTVKFKAE